uniref:Gst17 n=1 Tax=Arundo donax TaxID=35708 RepID=A0A0A9UPE7_ARUDO
MERLNTRTNNVCNLVIQSLLFKVLR